MLAAHRDQENLAHSRRVPTKQQPNTPGARYPRTPLGRNDENAPNTLFKKDNVAGVNNLGENGKQLAKGTALRQAWKTPMDTKSRAPLGNKTTNAKARTGQTAGVKDIVREIEKSQLKSNAGPTTSKPKQKFNISEPKAAFGPIGPKEADLEEPEYAPPPPEPLPYKSDVLPEGGLTFNGLKKENILRGYYSIFHDQVDDDGVSRNEKEFNKEMAELLDKTIKGNDAELDKLSWNVADIADDTNPSRLNTIRLKDKSRPRLQNLRKPLQPLQNQSRPNAAMSYRSAASQKNPRIPKGTAVCRTLNDQPATRNRLDASNFARSARRIRDDAVSESTPGEAASRTTIGYKKGKMASSLVRSHKNNGNSMSNATKDKQFFLVSSTESLSDTVSSHNAAVDPVNTFTHQNRPPFTSIFYDEEDDGDLPAMCATEIESEDEEFQLKLDM